jgi:hypothetical protein
MIDQRERRQQHPPIVAQPKGEPPIPVFHRGPAGVSDAI